MFSESTQQRREVGRRDGRVSLQIRRDQLIFLELTLLAVCISRHQEASANGNTPAKAWSSRPFLSSWAALLGGSLEELALPHYPYMLIANFGEHLRMSLITPPAMHIVLTSGSSDDREYMISFIVIDTLDGGASPSPLQIQIQRPGRSLHVND